MIALRWRNEIDSELKFYPWFLVRFQAALWVCTILTQLALNCSWCAAAWNVSCYTNCHFKFSPDSLLSHCVPCCFLNYSSVASGEHSVCDWWRWNFGRCGWARQWGNNKRISSWIKVPMIFLKLIELCSTPTPLVFFNSWRLANSKLHFNSIRVDLHKAI